MSADGLVAHACGEDVIVFSLFSWTFNLMRFFLLVIKSIINSSALRCENEIFSMTIFYSSIYLRGGRARVWVYSSVDEPVRSILSSS